MTVVFRCKIGVLGGRIGWRGYGMKSTPRNTVVPATKRGYKESNGQSRRVHPTCARATYSRWRNPELRPLADGRHVC